MPYRACSAYHLDQHCGNHSTLLQFHRTPQWSSWKQYIRIVFGNYADLPWKWSAQSYLKVLAGQQISESTVRQSHDNNWHHQQTRMPIFFSQPSVDTLIIYAMTPGGEQSKATLRLPFCGCQKLALANRFWQCALNCSLLVQLFSECCWQSVPSSRWLEIKV